MDRRMMRKLMSDYEEGYDDGYDDAMRESRRMSRSSSPGRRRKQSVTKSKITKPKRKLSAWQKYIKNKKNHIIFRYK